MLGAIIAGMGRSFAVFIVIAMVAAGGCSAKHGGHSAGQAPSGAAAPIEFENRSLGIAISYPRTWSPRVNPDYALALGPPNAADPPAASITLDVPPLPLHLPGFIPIRQVKSGYLDDLRNKVGKIQTEEPAAPSIPDAQVRLVRSTWQSGGQASSESALLLVHDDHVYILRSTSDAAHEADTQAAFDAIVQSLRWVK